MSNNTIAKGSGLMKVGFDKDNQKLFLDFTGNDNQGCFRNDASILFFVASSYKSAFISIGNKIDGLFESVYIKDIAHFESVYIKDIAHLVLPYFFNFRHYVEMELKALIVVVSEDSPAFKHDLDFLAAKLYDCINKLSYDPKKYMVSQNEYNQTIEVLINKIDTLKTIIHKYSDKEPAEEYYRFIFEKDKKNMVLNNPLIELSLKEFNSLFESIESLFDDICKSVKRIKYFFDLL